MSFLRGLFEQIAFLDEHKQLWFWRAERDVHLYVEAPDSTAPPNGSETTALPSGSEMTAMAEAVITAVAKEEAASPERPLPRPVKPALSRQGGVKDLSRAKSFRRLLPPGSDGEAEETASDRRPFEDALADRSGQGLNGGKAPWDFPGFSTLATTPEERAVRSRIQTPSHGSRPVGLATPPPAPPSTPPWQRPFIADDDEFLPRRKSVPMPKLDDYALVAARLRVNRSERGLARASQKYSTKAAMSMSVKRPLATQTMSLEPIPDAHPGLSVSRPSSSHASLALASSRSAADLQMQRSHPLSHPTSLRATASHPSSSYAKTRHLGSAQGSL